MREQGVLNKELVFPMPKESIGNNNMVDISFTETIQFGLRPLRNEEERKKVISYCSLYFFSFRRIRYLDFV